MANIDKVSIALSEWVFKVASSFLPAYRIPANSTIGNVMQGLFGISPASYNVWDELGFLAEPIIQNAVSPMVYKMLGSIPDEQIPDMMQKYVDAFIAQAKKNGSVNLFGIELKEDAFKGLGAIMADKFKEEQYMDKELRKEFVEMLEHERNTPIGWAIIMSMVDMLAEDDELEQLAETHKGMQEYGQFLTEKEARNIVDGFRNYDGTRGAKWQPNVLFGAVESLGGKRSEMGKYNCWALYAVMNMMSSDYGGVIQTIAQGDTYAKVCYMMAVAWFADPDKRHDVREYFDL